MQKKCIICNEAAAEYLIKGTKDFYCQECAKQNFSDLSYLIKVEEQAKALKQIVDDRLEQENKEGDKEEDNEE